LEDAMYMYEAYIVPKYNEEEQSERAINKAKKR
jgi:hypothetical protein